jgi:hypothetical protein
LAFCSFDPEVAERLLTDYGKDPTSPCHHRLDQCLHDYIEKAGITDDVDGFHFRSARRKTGHCARGIFKMGCCSVRTLFLLGSSS